MVVIDSTFLSLMAYEKSRPPKDPSTQKPVERIEDRIEKLLEDLDSEAERMILPTPVLSEFLILVGKDASAYLERLTRMRNVLIKRLMKWRRLNLRQSKWKIAPREIREVVPSGFGRKSGLIVRSSQ